MGHSPSTWHCGAPAWGCCLGGQGHMRYHRMHGMGLHLLHVVFREQTVQSAPHKRTEPSRLIIGLMQCLQRTLMYAWG